MKNRKSNVWLLLGLALGSFCLSSCEKYPDGSGNSFSSKKSRITNSWRFEKVFNVQSATDETSRFATTTLDIMEDGTAIWTENGSPEQGTWEFDSKKENIVISSMGMRFSWQIRRLTATEFWYRDNVGSVASSEHHLVPR